MGRERSRVRTALVALLAVGSLAIGAVAAGAVDAKPGGQRIQLTGQVTASNVDAETGHSRGDVLVFTDDLFDEGGAHVGRSVAQAVVTSETLTLDPPAGDMLCSISTSPSAGARSLSSGTATSRRSSPVTPTACPSSAGPEPSARPGVRPCTATSTRQLGPTS